MSRTGRAARAAVVIAAGALVGAALPSLAGAQRSHPQVGYGGTPEPKRAPSTYPGASIIAQPLPLLAYGIWGAPLPPPRRQRYAQPVAPAVVYYVVPNGYYAPAGYGGFGSFGGYAGGVTDANGRPLSSGFDAPLAPSRDDFPRATPDLSGSSYMVTDDGAMLVDLPNGERRTIPACAAVQAEQDPDGRPRTIFYGGRTDGLVLRPGSRGRVQGAPTASSCYGIDGYGREVLY
jgi:hypothetical protein